MTKSSCPKNLKVKFIEIISIAWGYSDLEIDSGQCQAVWPSVTECDLKWYFNLVFLMNFDPLASMKKVIRLYTSG